MQDNVNDIEKNNLDQPKNDGEINQPSTTPQAASHTADAAEQKPEDPNWRAFREARKQDRLKREEAERKAVEKDAEIAALKSAMEAAFSRSAQPPQNAENQYEEESEEVRIEKKIQRILAAREAEAERLKAEREQREYPARLQQNYADFDKIVNAETLDYLEYHYPEVANPVKKLPDSYEKWTYIYGAIKRFVPHAADMHKEAGRADKNLQKPKSISSTSMSPQGEPSSSVRLSEERKMANWERMQKALRSLK